MSCNGKQKQRMPKFYLILCICAAVMVASIIAGGIVFYKFIEAYEITLPEHVIADFRGNIDYDFWENEMNRVVEMSMTEFEKERKETVFEYLRGNIRDIPISMRQKSDECTDEMLTYIARAGMKDIGIIRLVKADPVGFGYHMWEVGSVEFIDSFAEDLARQINITASQNAMVEINGITVTDDFAADSDIEYAKTYTVGNIFGEVELTVTEWNGTISEPYFAGINDYLYPIIEPFSREFNIIAAQGIDIFVDGIPVPDGSVTENIVPEIIAVYYKDNDMPAEDAPALYVRYNFEMGGFYDEPVITAKPGSSLAAGGYTEDNMIRRQFPDGTPVFETGVPDVIEEECVEVIETFLKAFVRFTGNVDGNRDGYFSSLSRYMLSGSDLYKRMNSARFTISTASISEIIIDTLEIDELKMYDNEFFSCHIYYTLTQTTSRGSREVTGNYSLLFQFINGRWLAVLMDNL